MLTTRPIAGRAEIAELKGRIERWRRGSSGEASIPEALWQEAVTLARVHGPGVTARQVGVDEASLAARLDGAAVAPAFVDAGPATALFAGALGAGLSSEGKLELELAASDGGRLTIRMPVAQWSQMLELVRELRGRQ